MKSVGMTDADLNDRLRAKKTEKKNVFLYTVDDAGGENWIFKDGENTSVASKK